MPTIAACLIVKNEEATLERCLASLRAYVDEINVYDTGSTDRTLALLERLAENADIEIEGVRVSAAPIRVLRGEWRDDFAWAREQSFAMASPEMEWLLLIDADEEMVGAKNLERILGDVPPEVDGLIFYWDIERDEAGNTVSQAWRERVVRRSAGYRWQGAAHSVLVPPEGRSPSLRPVPRDQVWFVHHHEPSRWHPDRALDILSAQVGSEGEHAEPRTRFYLGAELMWRGEFGPASEEFERFLASDGVPPDLRAAAAHRLAACLRALGKPEQAIEIELDSNERHPNWPETAVGLAASHAALERWDQVEHWARTALEVGVPESPFLHSPLKLRLLPHLRLAEADLARGDDAGAIASFDNAIRAANPTEHFARAHRSFRSALESGDTAGARRTLREAIARHDETLQGFARSIWLAAGAISSR